MCRHWAGRGVRPATAAATVPSSLPSRSRGDLSQRDFFPPAPAGGFLFAFPLSLSHRSAPKLLEAALGRPSLPCLRKARPKREDRRSGQAGLLPSFLEALFFWGPRPTETSKPKGGGRTAGARLNPAFWFLVFFFCGCYVSGPKGNAGRAGKKTSSNEEPKRDFPERRLKVAGLGWGSPEEKAGS